MTSRIDVIGQNGNISHAEDLERELNPPKSSLTHTQAVEIAKETGLCSDGGDCGYNTTYFGGYCDGCPNIFTEHNFENETALDSQNSNENGFREVKAVHENQSEQHLDMVNHPAHYQSENGIECIEAIRAQLTSDQFTAYCQGNISKYLWRWRSKGGVESLRKAKWYLDRMIAEVVDDATT